MEKNSSKSSGLGERQKWETEVKRLTLSKEKETFMCPSDPWTGDVTRGRLGRICRLEGHEHSRSVYVWAERLTPSIER